MSQRKCTQGSTDLTGGMLLYTVLVAFNLLK